MRKILGVLSIILIISCSLDTFNSDNLASWSINFDFPLFKTTYTIAELLNDYEELDVELYEDGPDSIYVFNTRTSHTIDVDFVITKDGDDVVPEIVPVYPYELEIPILPEELEGINFVDIDLLLEVDLTQFKTDLAESVIIDSLVITGVNDDGVIKTARIINQEILNTGMVEFSDPEDLINNRPTTVTVQGQITVYPTDAEGQEFNHKPIILNSILHAPMILEITEASTFSGSPEKVEGTVDDELFESLYLYVDIDNQIEIGGEFQVLISPDTLNFEVNSPIAPDILFSLDLLPDSHIIDTIEINGEKLSWLADTTYMKTSLNFIGYTDGQGNVQPTHLFTKDSIKVLLYSSAQLLIDPQNAGEEE